MNKSLFPDGVEVHSVDLTRESAAKQAAILGRHVDTSQMGVLQGLRVTPNLTQVAVSAGSAYTPNGELVVLGLAAGAVGLDDATAGVVNYVCLIYKEAKGNPEPHENLAQTFNTSQSATTPVVRCYSVTNYNALGQSGDPTSATNFKDYIVIVATVVGQGVGVNIPNGAISQPSLFTTIVGSDQPSTLSGVQIETISSATPNGPATIRWDPALSKLYWAAPSGPTTTEAEGAGILITGDGLYTLPSSTITKTVVVKVIFGLLPVAPVTNTISVAALYFNTAPRFSARDEEHRHMLGSGTPTPTNPHGYTLADITDATLGGALTEHQELEHSTGIVKDTTQTQPLRPLLEFVRSAPTAHTVTVTDFDPSNNDKAVVNGFTISKIAGSNVVSFADVKGVLPANTQTRIELYGIYLNEDGTVSHGITWNAGEAQPRVQYTPTVGQTGDAFSGTMLPVDVSDNWQPNISENVRLVYDVALDAFYLAGDTGVAPDTTFAKYTVQRPAGTTSILRLYMNDGVRWMDVWYDDAHFVIGITRNTLLRIIPNPDPRKYLLLGYVVSHGSTAGTPVLGYSQFNTPSGTVNNVIYHRSFGTLDSKRISDALASDLSVRPLDELRGDGVIVGFGAGTLVGTSLPISGGAAYLRGHRFELPSQNVNFAAGAGTYWLNLDKPITAGHDELDDGTPVMTLIKSGSIPTTGFNLWKFVFSGVAITSQFRIGPYLTNIDNNVGLVVGPGGMFSTLADAFEYMNNTPTAPRTVVVRGTIQERTMVTLPSDVTIRGEGGTIVPPLAIDPSGVILDANATLNVKIRDLKIDVQNVANTIGIRSGRDTLVSGCLFNNSGNAGGAVGVWMAPASFGTSNAIVENCVFTSIQTGVLNSASGGLLNKFTVRNNAFLMIFDQSYRCISLVTGALPTIQGNSFLVGIPPSSAYLTNTAYAITGNQIGNAVITGNYMKDWGVGATLPAHEFLDLQSGGSPSISDTTVANNSVENVLSLAVFRAGTATNLSITNNLYSRTNGTGTLQTAAAAIDFLAGCVLSNVKMSGNTFSNPPAFTIRTRDIASSIEVTGNSCRSLDGKSSIFYLHQYNTQLGSVRGTWNVSGNYMEGMNTASSISDTTGAQSYCAGIAIFGAGAMTVKDNNIYKIGQSATAKVAGVVVGSQSTVASFNPDVVINNNDIDTIGSVALGTTNSYGVRVIYGGNVSLVGNTISIVTAGTAGYGASLENYLRATVSDNTFATLTTAGVHTTVNADNLTVSGNTFNSAGACVFCENSVGNLTIMNNTARLCTRMLHGAAGIANATITGNASLTSSEFILSEGALIQSTIADNVLGATYAIRTNAASMNSSSFIGNTMDSVGYVLGIDGQIIDSVISGNVVTQYLTGGIACTALAAVDISDNVFDQGVGDCISASGPSSAMTISGNQISSITGRAIVFSSTVSDSTFNDNSFAALSSSALTIAGNVTGITISDNTFKSITGTGIGITGQTLDSSIKDNVFGGVTLSTIRLLNQVQKVSISGNVADNCGTLLTSQGVIALISSTTVVVDSTIQGNVFRDCGATGHNVAAIYVDPGNSTFHTFSIKNNIVSFQVDGDSISIVNGGNDGNQGFGIDVSGNSVDGGADIYNAAILVSGRINGLSIVGNRIKTTNGANGTTNAIRIFNSSATTNSQDLCCSNNICATNNSADALIRMDSGNPAACGITNAAFVGNVMRRDAGTGAVAGLRIHSTFSTGTIAANSAWNVPGGGSHQEDQGTTNVTTTGNQPA